MHWPAGSATACNCVLEPLPLSPVLASRATRLNHSVSPDPCPLIRVAYFGTTSSVVPGLK